jgi:hypothetical protein
MRVIEHGPNGIISRGAVGIVEDEVFGMVALLAN